MSSSINDKELREAKRLRMTSKKAPTFEALPLMPIVSFLDTVKDLCAFAATCKKAQVTVEKHCGLLLEKLPPYQDEHFKTTIKQHKTLAKVDSIPSRYMLARAFKTPLRKIAADDYAEVSFGASFSPSETRVLVYTDNATLSIYDLNSHAGASPETLSLLDEVPSRDAAGKHIPTENWDGQYKCYFIDEYKIAVFAYNCFLIWDSKQPNPQKSIFLLCSVSNNIVKWNHRVNSLKNGEYFFPLPRAVANVDFYKFNLEDMAVRMYFSAKLPVQALSFGAHLLWTAFERFVLISTVDNIYLYDYKEIRVCDKHSSVDTLLKIEDGKDGTFLARLDNEFELWSLHATTGKIHCQPIFKLCVAKYPAFRLLGVHKKEVYVKLRHEIHIFDLFPKKASATLNQKPKRIITMNGDAMVSFKRNFCFVDTNSSFDLHMLSIPEF